MTVSALLSQLGAQLVGVKSGVTYVRLADPERWPFRTNAESVPGIGLVALVGAMPERPRTAPTVADHIAGHRRAVEHYQRALRECHQDNAERWQQELDWNLEQLRALEGRKGAEAA